MPSSFTSRSKLFSRLAARSANARAGHRASGSGAPAGGFGMVCRALDGRAGCGRAMSTGTVAGLRPPCQGVEEMPQRVPSKAWRAPHLMPAA
jgi:hypothetical protein